MADTVEGLDLGSFFSQSNKAGEQRDER